MQDPAEFCRGEKIINVNLFLAYSGSTANTA